MKSFTIASLFAALAAAAPSKEARSMIPNAKVGVPFALEMLKSGASWHMSGVSAIKSSLYMHSPSFDQGATCVGGNAASQATFVVDDKGSLRLYGDDKKQVVYVQPIQGSAGDIHFGIEGSLPANAVTTGWALGDTGVLTFNGKDLITCPYKYPSHGDYGIYAWPVDGNEQDFSACESFEAWGGAVSYAQDCTYSEL